jgi:hypothetical protein|tara:strand:- start:159 stop:491 length:333 start_codon:yes stop_codon:yes gene_type:complete
MNPKEDLIFYRDEKNNIFSGGYKIDNIFKKLNIPPLTEKRGDAEFIVPAGLFLLQQNYNTEEDTIPIKNSSNKIISEDLVDKLLSMSTKVSKSNTRKKRKKSKKLTRKNK